MEIRSLVSHDYDVTYNEYCNNYGYIIFTEKIGNIVTSNSYIAVIENGTATEIVMNKSDVNATSTEDIHTLNNYIILNSIISAFETTGQNEKIINDILFAHKNEIIVKDNKIDQFYYYDYDIGELSSVYRYTLIYTNMDGVMSGEEYSIRIN